MKFNIICLFPELIEQYFNYGVLKRSLEKKVIQMNLISLREFTDNKPKSVDGRPYGGGDGMVLGIEPLFKALHSLPSPSPVCYLSAQGERWSFLKAKKWSKKFQEITLICGRYSGIDERFISEYVHEEISIGDYVLTGGELAALVVIDSLCRFLPNVLGHPDSSSKDSFTENNLLEGPLFTRPESFRGLKVPRVFLEGDHGKIEKILQSIKWLKTLEKRPELLDTKEEEEVTAHKHFLKKHLSEEEHKLCGLKGEK